MRRHRHWKSDEAESERWDLKTKDYNKEGVLRNTLKDGVETEVSSIM